MNLNILVRGQSNAILMMESNGWAGYRALVEAVQELLGFDGVRDTVSLVYERYDAQTATATGGTALIGDWLEARNGDWRQGWSNGGLEQGLLAKVDSLPADQKDDPTATLWFHSEYDSTDGGLTAAEWSSAVRYDAQQVRAALGQGAETTPYLFVSAMPYWGTTQGHNAIREGMEDLSADASFNAGIAARTLDTDIDNDNTDGNGATADYGGPHMDAQDGMQTVQRAAKAIAEAFSAYARPGSPVAQAGGDIDDLGPEVVSVTRVATNQLRIDVHHDHATSFQALDADAARGVGWSVIGTNGAQVTGTAVSVVDADTLLVTFSGAVDPSGTLHYGYGYGRLAGADGSGRGNAVYDNEGMPIWVRAEGVTVGTRVSPADGGNTPPTTSPTTGRALDGTAGDDRLTGAAGPDTLAGGAGSDDLNGLGGGDRLAGGGGADTLRGGEGNDVLLGGAGNDSLLGEAGGDVLRGGAGDDRIATGAGADIVQFGAGDGADRVSDFALGTDRLVLLGGLTAASVSAGVAVRDGVSGLELRLGGGETLFLAGVGSATAAQLGLSGSFATGGTGLPATAATVSGTAGDDWLKGGAGADLLRGGTGSDDLQGLGGNDVLSGGQGDDGLTGGAGADVFAFARGDGRDWVVDFTPGTDRLWLEGIGTGSVTQAVEARWGVAGLAVHLGSGEDMFLVGVTARLGAGDIVFG